MKKAALFLLIIGIVAIAVSTYSLIEGQDFMQVFSGYFAGLLLIYGYWDLRKKAKEQGEE